MDNRDLELLKKKYGEHFAKLCRNLFPTILEQEGILSGIITEYFAESKSLYEDIISNKLENNFKQYIYSKFNTAQKQTVIDVVDPFVLMKKSWLHALQM